MKRSVKSILALLLTVLMVTTVFAGCAGSKTQQGGTASTGGTTKAAKDVLTFAQKNDVPTMDPQLANSMQCAEILGATNEGLVRMVNGKVQPGMAEKWDISQDGKTYTFHLRDAKWSDGKAVSAKDFEYAIRRLADPKTASPYEFAGEVIANFKEYFTKKVTDASQIGVKAIDDKTLEIKLVNPTAYFLGYTSLACFAPTRQDIAEKNGEKFGSDADKNIYNGPFIVKEWKHNDSMTLEKNPNYWDNKNIKLKTVKVLVVKDPNTQLNMYENGELDFVDVPNTMLDKYKDKSKTYMNGAIDWLRLNTKAAGKPWLANVDFRKALNYALNREDFVKSATNNLYFPFTRLVLPMVAGANGGKYTDEAKIDIYPAKGDTAKAKESLQKALTALNISDPKQITLEIKTSDDENSKKAVQVMQDQIQKALGITVTLKFVTYKQKLDDDTKGNYDAVVNGWMPDYDDPMTYMELFEGNNSSNSTGWKNGTYDKNIEAARVETDKAKRQQLFYDAEKILVDEAPFVPFQCRQAAYLQNDKLKNVIRYFIGSDIDYVYAYFE